MGRKRTEYVVRFADDFKEHLAEGIPRLDAGRAPHVVRREH